MEWNAETQRHGVLFLRRQAYREMFGLYDLALLCLFLCTSVFNIKNHTDVL